MARKSRKNTPIAVAEPTDNLTTKAVLSLDKEAKPYQVGIYARLSFESEANKERDTVDTQIAYIREFINGQDDMVEVCVYADISVTGTTFERPEFDRMIQDIRAGKINTVITRDLSRLGRNYVEAGNYIERVFPFLDVRYIAITDDFDTARPGTDLSVPLKNIVNEYYSKDLSKKVETGKHSIWAQGGFSEGTPPYGYYRATDGSRKLLIDEEVSDNVVRIFNMFLDGKGYAGIAKTLQSEGILSPPKYRFYKAGKTEFAEKARELDLIILEDGINSLLLENPVPPIAALAPENTVYMLSLSKTILPALRLAYLHVPERYTASLHNALYHLNLSQSSLLLELASRLIVSGKLEELLSNRREGIVERNRIFDEILKDYPAFGGKECLSRWLILPEGMTGAEFEQLAKEKGVSVYGSERFTVGKEVPVAAARLAVCAPQTKEELEKGLYLLKEILERK